MTSIENCPMALCLLIWNFMILFIFFLGVNSTGKIWPLAAILYQSYLWSKNIIERLANDSWPCEMIQI